MDPSINLKTILDLHAKWLRGESGGSRAYLSGADLSGAVLSRAVLSRAVLSGAVLSRADLSGAVLSRADLSGAVLSGAVLSRADLSGAVLSRAVLSRADLSGAVLSRADLSGAVLSRAVLSGADLSDCTGAGLALAMASHLPSDGPITGWKKCMDGVLVKLVVPEDSPRSHAATRKCRAKFVDVLEVIGAARGVSNYDNRTLYVAGQRVECDNWNPDRWDECSGGIHFFITRAEAEAYSL